MSPRISSMYSAGLSAMPPLSNVIPLPTRPRRRSGCAGVRRLVAQDDQPRRVVAAPADAERARPCRSSRISSGSSASAVSVSKPGRELRGTVGERLRGQLVRRARSARSRAWFVHAGDDRGAARSGSTSSAPTSVRRSTGCAVGRASLPGARVVAAQHGAVDGRASLLVRGERRASRRAARLRAADGRLQLADRGGGRVADGVGLELVPRAEAGRDDAATPDVDEPRAAALRARPRARRGARRPRRPPGAAIRRVGEGDDERHALRRPLGRRRSPSRGDATRPRR